MADETFIDTSGFYSLLVRRDPLHARAAELVADAADVRGRFVTTDYVIDETVTLLKARGHGELVEPLFQAIDYSEAMRVEWTTSERFAEASSFCLRHTDKAWSFTDCVSFAVMQSLRLTRALTSDNHFEQGGFQVLLKD